MEFKRCSGILMPISSLPGGYGIGSMGKPARDFVDFLAKAGQTIWQILPVGPTGYADSPYQSCSAFAGNPYFIDLDLLAADGMLTKKDYAAMQPRSITAPCMKSALPCCARPTTTLCGSARSPAMTPLTRTIGTVSSF